METKAGSKYCCDPLWVKDAVSKFLESPVYSVPLLDFIGENCGMFEDSDDNKLEYTILGNSVPTFVHMLANEVHTSLYSIVVTSILIVDDFLLFKEMMLKRDFQISNQALNQITNLSQELEEPVDLHSVIDHLSDVSKQQLSDKETAKSLSLTNSYQQQAKVKEIDSAANYDPAACLSRPLGEEKKKKYEDHAEIGDQREEKHQDEGKEKLPCPQNLGENPKEVVEAPAPPDNSFQEKKPTREPSTSSGTESKVTFKNDSSKLPNKVQTSQQKIATKTTSPEIVAASVMENRKDNPSTVKLSFETPREVVFPGKPETEIPLEGDDDEFGDDFDGARRVDLESQEPKEEQVSEPTTSKMLEDLLGDVKMWKPKSLHVNVNDGEIQQRRCYLERQRDRILTDNKSAREKQMRFSRQLESNADASPQNLRRSIQPMQALLQDAEANIKRETLRKELARCLKEELSNKTSNMSPDSKKIRQGNLKTTTCLSATPTKIRLSPVKLY